MISLNVKGVVVLHDVSKNNNRRRGLESGQTGLCVRNINLIVLEAKGGRRSTHTHTFI